tara:strand:+ start:302753 stop:304666 length:1914 start_codon:yes stop_codon:yes gene_type:complete
MNANFMSFSKIIDSEAGAREHYHVPKYQREYTWGKKDWERLTQDIEENDPGYFMGSIICVKDGEFDAPGAEILYELIDGQQRLTTLSIYMMAIYSRLKEHQGQVEFDDEDDEAEFIAAIQGLRNKLIKRKAPDPLHQNQQGGWLENGRVHFLRVKPSSQNRNLSDFEYLLGNVGVIAERDKPHYHGVRAISKAFQFFKENLPGEIEELISIAAKINQLNFVHITVGSQADAYTLFETLNNRGVPLSAIDIIKNKFLASMEKQHGVNIDESYARWQELIKTIPDTTNQERFLRHFYNAFTWDEDVHVENMARATKSNLIAIYERLIKANAQQIFDRLCKASKIYGSLVDPDNFDLESDLQSKLSELVRIGASPANQIMLYLFSKKPSEFAEPCFLSSALDLISRYYVRRNVTDFPGTKSLDANHMDLIESCQRHIEEGNKLSFEYFRNELLSKDDYANLEAFKSTLLGSMYSTNSSITRYLLTAIDKEFQNREYAPDLWLRNDKGKLVWTIEHVLPQQENISLEWIEMLADGDADKARCIHEDNVHKLGNLTLSGYNSRLSAASFEKKQTLAEDRKFLGHKINIGYQNGLGLNNLKFNVSDQELSLSSAPVWTTEMINARTNAMVDMIVEKYRFHEID